MKPLVSCIIPAYNREKYIANAIESVLTQTFSNWELLVVDDRSKDKTAEIINNYVNTNKNVQYILNTHKQGPAGARNQGIQMAKGRYIAFLDSDDIWKSWHLEDAFQILEKNPMVDWLFTDMERYQDGQLITSSYFSEISPKMIQFETIDCSGANIIIDPMAFKKSIKNPLPCYIQTSVFRKSFFDTIQFDENLIGVEDALIQWVALNKKKCMAYINKVHLQYYVHESNISNANNSGSDLEKSIDRNNELEKLYKAAMLLDLTNDEANALRHNLGELYFWRFGQMCYGNTNDKNTALQYFLKGIKLSPFNIYFWKSLIAFMFKNGLKKISL